MKEDAKKQHCRRKPPWLRRATLLLFGLVVALALGEAGLALYNRHFRWAEFRKPIAYTEDGDRNRIGVAVLGGSTAQGSPTAGFSMGVSLQGLLYSRCGMGTRLQSCALGGWALEDAMRAWWNSAETRPDVMILYSGHNQLFRYYPPGMTPPPLGVLGHLRTVRLLLHWLCVRQPYEDHATYSGGLFCDTPIPWYERESGLADYRAQLELLIRHCEENDICLVVVVPAANYTMPPNRSQYAGPPQRRAEALRLFKQACHSKYFQDDDDTALALLQRVAGFCSFAHLHYELGEIYYRRGNTRQAVDQLARARDLDGYWVRMPEPYRRIITELSAKHDVPLVDMRRVIRDKLGRAVPDGEVFYDHVHFNPDAYMALEEEILDLLLKERAAGLEPLPQQIPLPAEWQQRIAVTSANRAGILAQAMNETRTAAADETFMKYPVYMIARDKLNSIKTDVLPPQGRAFVANELAQLETLIADERQRMLRWTQAP
ncbi:MAG: hypothetical protein HN919_22170 [Verrucomicrobia bacterium]|jgi:hypothetical protein|nr:hypothetical protein [Verrucomicrobiota bacterium]MBT7069020.1 hypothetical protein [Verrucomicrobiota bacterium]MBT7700126.1 hypothetical protein [Verrucomicrobiota bacterium]